MAGLAAHRHRSDTPKPGWVRMKRVGTDTVGGSGPGLQIRSGEELSPYVARARALLDFAGEIEAFVQEAAGFMADTFQRGGRALICGCGGSAAMAQHLATELVGRFEAERVALPAIALGTDGALLTALTNDYGPHRIFARQIEALGRDGDVVLVMTTSGKSPSVLDAVRAARGRGCAVMALTGSAGLVLADESPDFCLRVASTDVPLIQEFHLIAIHRIAGLVESRFRRGV